MDKLADLSILITLLRAEGITHYKNGDLELTLGAVPAHLPEAVKEETPSEKLTDLERSLRDLPPQYRKAFTVNAGDPQ